MPDWNPPYALHRCYMDKDTGRIICKDTCPRDDCEEAMKEWNGDD